MKIPALVFIMLRFWEKIEHISSHLHLKSSPNFYSNVLMCTCTQRQSLYQFKHGYWLMLLGRIPSFMSTGLLRSSLVLFKLWNAEVCILYWCLFSKQKCNKVSLRKNYKTWPIIPLLCYHGNSSSWESRETRYIDLLWCHFSSLVIDYKSNVCCILSDLTMIFIKELE